MGLMFPVHPPKDLEKLDKKKRKELADAIRKLVRTDRDVQQLLKDKTWKAVQADRKAKALLKKIERQESAKDRAWSTFQLLRDKTLITLSKDRDVQKLLKKKTGARLQKLKGDA